MVSGLFLSAAVLYADHLCSVLETEAWGEERDARPFLVDVSCFRKKNNKIMAGKRVDFSRGNNKREPGKEQKVFCSFTPNLAGCFIVKALESPLLFPLSAASPGGVLNCWNSISVEEIGAFLSREIGVAVSLSYLWAGKDAVVSRATLQRKGFVCSFIVCLQVSSPRKVLERLELEAHKM